MNGIKISQFPIKPTITEQEYLIAIEGTQNYLISLSSYFAANFNPVLAEVNIVQNDLISVQNDLNDKLPKVINGIEILTTNTTMLSSHFTGYLSFTEENTSKTYTVVENDGFPIWGSLMLRNSAAVGNLLVGYTGNVTLDGNQDNLLVTPKRTLQLVKADVGVWHII